MLTVTLPETSSPAVSVAGVTETATDQSAESTTSTGILEIVRAHLASIPAAEQRVGRAVLNDPAGVLHLSVTELAAVAGSSPATVVRFCKSVGLRRYQELKLALARESIPAEQQLLDEITVSDDASSVRTKVLATASSALQAAAQTVDADTLDLVARLLARARRVLFVAVGTSAPLAADIAYRLTTIGVNAVFPADVHVQHVTARMLERGDLCFVISHTGSTTETLAAVRTAATTGADTVAVTSFARSPLTEVADHVLVAGSRETAYRIESMTSRLVHLAVLDALYVLIALREPQTHGALSATEEILLEHRI